MKENKLTPQELTRLLDQIKIDLLQLKSMTDEEGIEYKQLNKKIINNLRKYIFGLSEGQ